MLSVIAHVLNSLRPCELQGEAIEQVEALEQFLFGVASQYPTFARPALEVFAVIISRIALCDYGL